MDQTESSCTYSTDGKHKTYAPYVVEEAANAILNLAHSHGEGLQPMKLEKLLYYAQGWSLVDLNLLFFKGGVYAERTGPMVPHIRDKFRRFGLGDIPVLARLSPTIKEDDDYIPLLLDRLWEVFGDHTSVELSNMTHDPNGPWSKTLVTAFGKALLPNGGPLPKFTPIIISNQDMINYFSLPQGGAPPRISDHFNG